VALLAINLFSVLLLRPASQPRVTVPFSPFFIREVNAGKVKLITTKGDTVQGTFTAKLTYRRLEDGDNALCDAGPFVLERQPARGAVDC